MQKRHLIRPYNYISEFKGKTNLINLQQKGRENKRKKKKQREEFQPEFRSFTKLDFLLKKKNIESVHTTKISQSAT